MLLSRPSLDADAIEQRNVPRLRSWRMVTQDGGESWGKPKREGREGPFMAGLATTTAPLGRHGQQVQAHEQEPTPRFLLGPRIAGKTALSSPRCACWKAG